MFQEITEELNNSDTNKQKKMIEMFNQIYTSSKAETINTSFKGVLYNKY